jgi:diaminohydroxyphosphoribosylaminopyrimidine deaminase/5-amino-6-(5-phosphoribosylamino)uracil reductase
LLSAIGTVLADDPEFTCRLPGLEADSPSRFILDSSLRTPPTARLFATAPHVGVTIFCREDCEPRQAEALRNAGAQIQSVPSDEQGRLALRPVMEAIAATGCGSLMVEGGGKLAASLLQEGLVDRILWTRSQHLIGGDGIPAIGDLGATGLSDPAAFAVLDEGRMDSDRFILLERPADIG